MSTVDGDQDGKREARGCMHIVHCKAILQVHWLLLQDFELKLARKRDINQNNNAKKLRQSKVLIFYVRKIIRAFLRHLQSYDFISRSNTWRIAGNYRENSNTRPIQLGIVPSIYLIF